MAGQRVAALEKKREKGGARRERVGGKSELYHFSKITLKSLLNIINYN